MLLNVAAHIEETATQLPVSLLCPVLRLLDNLKILVTPRNEFIFFSLSRSYSGTLSHYSANVSEESNACLILVPVLVIHSLYQCLIFPRGRSSNQEEATGSSKNSGHTHIHYVGRMQSFDILKQVIFM
jgi:hypothetical protein